ncbi:MAG: BatD family protein [Phycisphaerae bacterium]
MLSFKKTILSVAFALAFPALCFAAQLRVQAGVTSGEIYAGRPFTYQIVIYGADNALVADESPLKDFSPGAPSYSDASQHSVTIINGRRTESSTKRYVITYQLTAKKPGAQLIPALTVTVDSEQYLTNPVDIEVLSPKRTDSMDFTMTLAKNTVFAGETVELSFRWYIAADIVSNNQMRNHSFDIPAFDDERFTIEESAIDNQSSDRINVSGFDTGILQKKVIHNGMECLEVSFAKVLIPLLPGHLELAPAKATCDIAIGINRSGSFFSQSYKYGAFMAESEGLELNVLPLPQEGRPADFSGLVGEYKISAEASPIDVKVGDPITLKITVEGNYLKPVKWPELEKIQGFADNFILPAEKGSPETSGGKKVFTHTIRAKDENVSVIPAIPLSFFDCRSGKYITLASKEIALNVSPTKIITVADIEGMDGASAGSEIKALKEGISANYSADELLFSEQFSPREALFGVGGLVLWALPSLFLVAAAIYRLAACRNEEAMLRKRKRNALKKALAALKKARASGAAEGREAMVSAICGYYADSFGMPKAAVTPLDCHKLTFQKTQDAAAADCIAELLEKAQASEYSPVSEDFDKNWCDKAAEILRRTDK